MSNSEGECMNLITVKEITEELHHQDASKACGMDDIHIRLISATTFVHALAALYNSCIKYGRTPRVWNDTMVCLIVKYHAQREDADNFRPITLINIFRKVFERLLLRRYSLSPKHSLEPTHLLSCPDPIPHPSPEYDGILLACPKYSGKLLPCPK